MQKLAYSLQHKIKDLHRKAVEKPMKWLCLCDTFWSHIGDPKIHEESLQEVRQRIHLLQHENIINKKVLTTIQFFYSWMKPKINEWKCAVEILSNVMLYNCFSNEWKYWIIGGYKNWSMCHISFLLTSIYHLSTDWFLSIVAYYILLDGSSYTVLVLTLVSLRCMVALITFLLKEAK